MQASTLQTKELCKTFIQADKPLPVLKNMSLSFSQNKTYAITGASGSGKSTLLHLLGGLDTPTSGTILFNDQDLEELKGQKKEYFLNKSLGFVFQFHYLINELTVLENIMVMGLITGKPKHQCLEHAKKLLAQVDLLDKADSHPYLLSGGEQQRVSILRALFNKPDFLLADEPTGNLDATNAQQVVDFLKQCQQEWNMGIILCSHDKAVYERMDQVFELKDGVLVNKKS